MACLGGKSPSRTTHTRTTTATHTSVCILGISFHVSARGVSGSMKVLMMRYWDMLALLKVGHYRAADFRQSGLTRDQIFQNLHWALPRSWDSTRMSASNATAVSVLMDWKESLWRMVNHREGRLPLIGTRWTGQHFNDNAWMRIATVST